MIATRSTGVIKVLGIEDRSYYTCSDVMQLLGVSKSKAYSIIQELRDELEKQGKLSPVYPRGKIPKTYFNDRCCIGGSEDEKKTERAC